MNARRLRCPIILLSYAVFALGAFWTLLALFNWRELSNGVRFASPWSAYDYGQAMLFGGPVQLTPILGCVFLNLAAALVGYRAFVKPIWGDRGVSGETWLVIAGLLPGMLIFIAAARVVTLLVTNSIAAPLLLSAAALAAAWGGFGLVRCRTRNVSGFAKLRLGSLRDPLIAVAIFAAFLLLQVEIDQAHALAEGSIFFIRSVFLSPAYGIGTNGHWPLISQHYDEAAFLFPVVYGLVQPGADADATLTAVYWVMLAAGRLGAAVITFVSLRGLNLDRLSALVVIAFVGLSSLSLNPFSSRLIFDSLNPLAFCLHPSRIIAPILPLVLVSAASNPVQRLRLGGLATAFLMGIGLASMTIHIALVLAAALAVAIAIAWAPNLSALTRSWRAAAVCGLVILTTLSVTYGLTSLPAPLRMAVAVGGSVTSIVVMLIALLRSRPLLPLRDLFSVPVVLMLALLAGYGISLVLLGNMLVDRFQIIAGALWPWPHVDMVARYYSTLASKAIGTQASPYCDEGYVWTARELTGHCASLPMFARTYGLAVVVLTSIVAWRLWRLDRSADASPHDLTAIFWGIVGSLLALPLAFVLFDFPAPPTATIEDARFLSIWLRSRLIEPWFYGGVMLALTLFLREASRRARAWVLLAMLCSVAVFAFNPMVLPAQIAANASYLMALLAGGGS